MKNYELWDYYSWNNVFDSEKIKIINEIIEKTNNGNEPSEWATPWKNVSSVKTVNYGHLAPLLKHFLDQVQIVCTEGFGYNIFNIYNNQTLNYSIYNSKDKADYDWHRDISGSPMFDTKLTLLINLSDEEYEGGQFQILTENEPFTADSYSSPGSAFMFKSHILHRVLPVTSGIRKSLALFIKGPRFQ
jgi:hypothetical protein